MKTQSNNHSKSKVKLTRTAYAMCFALGFHHAYLGNWGRQFLLLSMPIIGFFLFTVSNTTEIWWIRSLGIGLSVMAVFWYLFDIFRMPGYVRSVNKKRMLNFEG